MLSRSAFDERRRCPGGTLIVALLLLATALPAAAQSRANPAGDCGAAICLQTGVGRWQIEPAEYCDADVCLQAELASLLELDWDRLISGSDALGGAARNPYIGLTDAEYAQLESLGTDRVRERVQLLGKVRVSCAPREFSLRLDVPGRDIVIVTFATPLAAAGRGQTFQVTRIDRTYRDLPGGSIGWWIRWVTYRFPGIVLMDGEPADFANYEIGLYMGRLVLADQSFTPGAAPAYGQHPACAAR